MTATHTLFFDGGGDTYMLETSADILDFYVGGIQMLRLDEANGIIDIRADNIRVLAENGGTYVATGGTSLMTGSQLVCTAEVTISEAEMNALHTTGKVLVAAPGANKVVIPIKVTAFVDRDALTAQGNAVSMMIGMAGASVLTAGVWTYFKSFMRMEGGDRILQSVQMNEVLQNLTDGDNRDLTAKMSGAITSASIDSCKLIVQYYIYDNS